MNSNADVQANKKLKLTYFNNRCTSKWTASSFNQKTPTVQCYIQFPCSNWSNTGKLLLCILVLFYNYQTVLYCK